MRPVTRRFGLFLGFAAVAGACVAAPFVAPAVATASVFGLFSAKLALFSVAAVSSFFSGVFFIAGVASAVKERRLSRRACFDDTAPMVQPISHTGSSSSHQIDPPSQVFSADQEPDVYPPAADLDGANRRSSGPRRS